MFVPEPIASKSGSAVMFGIATVCGACAGICEVCEIISGGDDKREVEELRNEYQSFQVGPRRELQKKKYSDQPCQSLL
jgi:hypothetical protein